MKTSITLLKSLLFLSLCTLVISSCQDEKVVIEDVLPEQTTGYYSSSEQAHLNSILSLPTAGPFDYNVNVAREIAGSLGQTTINSDLATLGRVLFYDKEVSKTSAVSCGSCHKQELAFADDAAFSEGFSGAHTDRNSLSLGSFISFQLYYDTPIGPAPTAGFFWDERATSLGEQMAQTIANDKEMGMDLSELSDKLSSPDHMHYRVLFNKAFGDHNIYPNRIVSALEAFVNSMVTSNSRYDKEIIASGGINARAEFPNFTAAENRGKDIFMSNCASCHGSSITAAHRSQVNAGVLTVANNGLDVNYADQGLGEVSNHDYDNGKFKVPVLRNIELSAPYMHDGRFETLEEVVEFYSTGVQDHDNLHPNLKDNNGPKKLNLSPSDSEALVAFLKTFTDQTFITAEKYSDPFVK